MCQLMYIDNTSSERNGGEEAYLNQVLSFGLGDEGLQFRSRKGVDQSGLGDDEQEDLSSSEDRQLIRLLGGRDTREFTTCTHTPQARQPTNGIPNGKWLSAATHLLHDSGLSL